MKKKMLQKNRGPVSLQGGFTLVESLFSILILTFTITGLMTILSNSLFSARYSKDEITANYLLQEVADYVRNDRDATVFLGGSWDDFTGHYTECLVILGSGDGCFLDVNDTKDITDDKITICDGGDCPVLYYDENAIDRSFYNYKVTNSNGDDNLKTNFIRKITVEEGQGNDEFKLTVNISWKNGSSILNRSLSTILMNWKK